MLNHWSINSFYKNQSLHVPKDWKLARKHFRLKDLNGRFVKLNRFENRINERELRKYCVRFSPVHVYFSVLDWLFPERVGKKCKANRALPISGEYVIDIDSYLLHRRHRHNFSKSWNVCNECLEAAKFLTIEACFALEKYYSNVSVVFSGKNGFHIHVHDFKVRDWTRYKWNNPIKSHEVARFKFTKTLSFDVDCFDRYHFIVSTDPMRLITVPGTMNAESGLICNVIGDRKDLERKSVNQIIQEAVPFGSVYGYPEPLRRGCEISA